MVCLENITPRIIERLYLDAIVLSDEVSDAFAAHACEIGAVGNDAESVAIALEALRATSRMMSATAWLLNHRAYFRGELTERQYRNLQPLESDLFKSTPGNVGRLPPDLQALVHETEEFHSRLLRLERDEGTFGVRGHGSLQAMLSKLKLAVSGTGQTNS